MAEWAWTYHDYNPKQEKLREALSTLGKLRPGADPARGRAMIATSPLSNLAAVLFGLALTLSCRAEVSADDRAARESDAPEAAAALPADARAVTQHVISSPTGDLRYEATAAALTLKDGKGRPSSRIFYIAYVREGSEPRPLTFVFNGGPGAASAYLHLGAMGPRRVVLEENGAVPPPPVRLTDNAQSWLTFTDLVFVDPPGTGYSRLLDEKGTGENKVKKQSGGKTPAWGIEEDAEILGAFIRRYLTQEQRWASPVFLAGESYGGFRVSLLSERLFADEGIAPSGLVLISPVLDFALLRGGDQVLLRWCALLPTYAAVASHHGLGVELELDTNDPRNALREIEEYAVGDLLMAISSGMPQDAERRREMLERLAAYTGLPGPEIRRHRARIPASRFAKVLLADSERLVSLYDGSLTEIDPQPAAARIGRDLYLERLGTALTAGFHVHVRETLEFESDLPYRLLNVQVSEAWNWDSGIRGSQGFAEVRGDLRRALSLNPAMQVLVLHGVHDLVTPYFASALSLSQMELDSQLKPNLRLVLYPGGHMFYTRRESRERLREDAARFYREASDTSDVSPTAPASGRK